MIMKNVLFIHSSSELYGSDRSLLNIVKNIDKRYFNVFVILPCPGPLVEEMRQVPGVKVEIFEVAVLRRKNLSISGGIEYFRAFCNSCRFIKKYIKENRIDIVDTNTAVVFPGAVTAKHMKVKSVWHIREIIKSQTENKVISYMMNRYADLIVANSKSTGVALKVNQNKVRVVYNAVDKQLCNEPIPHNVLTVGMAGRINRWKGQKLFVDAAEVVHKEFPNVKFNIAGDVYSGEDFLREDLINYIKQKDLTDTVVLLGQVNDMQDFYRNIDIFVLPSIQPEPFGLVVIEAMEYGLPVIATNHGGPTEIIDDGNDGFLVDFKDANEMASRIMELIRNPEERTTIGQRGKEKKYQNFSVISMTKGIESVFEEALEN